MDKTSHAEKMIDIILLFGKVDGRTILFSEKGSVYKILLSEDESGVGVRLLDKNSAEIDSISGVARANLKKTILDRIALL